jgi:hypothetical protein
MSDRDREPVPRWVIAGAVVTGILVIGFVILHLTGYGMAGMH